MLGPEVNCLKCRGVEGGHVPTQNNGGPISVHGILHTGWIVSRFTSLGLAREWGLAVFQIKRHPVPSGAATEPRRRYLV